MIQQQLTDDVKAAMLSGDAHKVETLRGLKSAILYAEVAAKKRDAGLNDEEVLAILAKESKKRQESANLYVQGGAQDKADKELTEKAMIDAYLPAQLSESEIATAVEAAIAEQGATDMSAMGKVIGAVKQQLGGAADGSIVARLVKEKLGN